MSLEEKLQKLLSTKWKPMRFGNLEYWKWHGSPGFLSPQATVPKPIDIDLGRLILAANESECLTSPSEYVRELKKWFKSHKEDEYKILFQCYDPTGTLLQMGEELDKALRFKPAKKAGRMVRKFKEA